MGQQGRAKALTLIKGRPLLEVILDEIGDLFDEVVIVSSPKHEQDFLKYLKTRTNLPKSRVVVQQIPRGSLDAINTGSKFLRSDCIVVWGDQIGVSRSTIELLMREKSSGYHLIVPKIFTEHPYVWLEFSENSDHVLGIGRQRDGDTADKGWADLGVFYFSTDALRRLRPIQNELISSLGGREIDLTYAIPVLSRQFDSHFPIRTNSLELLAVNTMADISIAEELIDE